MRNDLHWQAQADQAVTNFVLAELDLVFDLITSAKISQQPERQRQIIAIARQAVSTVRHFEGRIKDTTDLKDIHDRANELEKLVCSLRDGLDKECQEPLEPTAGILRQCGSPVRRATGWAVPKADDGVSHKLGQVSTYNPTLKDE